MDLLVRYWDKIDKERKVGFLKGNFLGPVAAKEFYENHINKRET